MVIIIGGPSLFPVTVIRMPSGYAHPPLSDNAGLDPLLYRPIQEISVISL